MIFIFDIFKIFFNEKSSLRFLFGIIFGMSFSVSIILATIGIMDGYERSLYGFVYNSEGHYILQSKKGYFDETILVNSDKIDVLPVIESRGMALGENDSVGVIINGVNDQTYSEIFKRSIELNSNDIIIGIELAKKLKKSVGDFLALSFLSNNTLSQAPIIRDFKISKIINHGFYNKNLRVVLVNKNHLSKLVSQNGRVNKVMIRFKNKIDKGELFKIESKLDYSFRLVSTLKKFEYLLKAVKAEKVMIIIVLQLIVIISVFNLYTFVNFLKEKKQQEFFLLKSLGVRRGQFLLFFSIMIGGLWFISCNIAIILIQFYQFLLQRSDFLKLPGDIYHISRLSLNLAVDDYLLVFLLALFWIIFMIGVSARKLTQVSLTQGLKGEMV